MAKNPSQKIITEKTVVVKQVCLSVIVCLCACVRACEGMCVLLCVRTRIDACVYASMHVYVCVLSECTCTYLFVCECKRKVESKARELASQV